MSFKQKSNGVRSKELSQLIVRINTEDIATVSLLLVRRGKELLLHCLEHPDKLKIKSEDGYTIADTLASYGPTDVVKLLLEYTKTDDTIRKLITETHELAGGVAVETFALAIATLKERNEYDNTYLKLAGEIKLLSRITEH